MGSGYAVYCPASASARVVALAHESGLDAVVAGSVEGGPRQVIVEPLGVVYAGDELEFATAEHPPS
jgi:phosphoribosylformylglycinamidine cyclo-ligase